MKKILVFLSSFCICITGFSQDLEPFQYSQNSLLLNPAFAGSWKTMRVSADSRIDYWGSKKDVIQGLPSNTFSVDHYIGKIKSGVGINFNSSYPDFGTNISHLNHTGLNYSFHIPIGKDSTGNAKYFLQTGVEYAYQYNTLDNSQLVYGTLYTGPHFPVYENVSYSDLSAGFIFYGKDICVGFSARHLNQPNEAYMGVYKLPVAYSGSLVYTKRFIESKPNYFIQPNLYWINRSETNTFMIGFKINLDLISIGMSYSTKQEMAYSLGVRYGPFQLSYIYEHIAYVSDYAHTSIAQEITLRMKLFTKKNKSLVSTQNIL